MTYIQRINEIMEDRDITPAELARKLNEDKSNTNKKLKEEGRYFSIEELIKICSILDISPNYILGYTEIKNSLNNKNKIKIEKESEQKIIKLINKINSEIREGKKSRIITSENEYEYTIETEYSICINKDKTQLTNKENEITKITEKRKASEKKKIINQILLNYDNNPILKELLTEAIEDKIDENIEILILELAGIINEKTNKSCLDIIIEKARKKYC